MLSDFFVEPVDCKIGCKVRHVRYPVVKGAKWVTSSANVSIDACTNLSGNKDRHIQACCQGKQADPKDSLFEQWDCNGTKEQVFLLTSKTPFRNPFICSSGSILHTRASAPLRRHIRRGALRTDGCEGDVQRTTLCGTPEKVGILRETMLLGKRAIPWTDIEGDTVSPEDIGWSDKEGSMTSYWIPDSARDGGLDAGKEVGQWLSDLMLSTNYILKPLLNRENIKYATCEKKDLGKVWLECGNMLSQDTGFCITAVGSVLLHLLSCTIYRMFYDSYDSNPLRLTVDIAREGRLESFVKRSLTLVLSDFLAEVGKIGFKMGPMVLLNTTSMFVKVFGSGPTYYWKEDDTGQSRVYMRIKVGTKQLQQLRRGGETMAEVFHSMVRNFFPDEEAQIMYQRKPYVSRDKLLPSFRLDPSQKVRAFVWGLSGDKGFVEMGSSFLRPDGNMLEKEFALGAMCSSFEFEAEVRAFSPMLAYHYVGGPFTRVDKSICKILSNTDSQPMAVFVCEPYLEGGSVDAVMKARKESCLFSVSFKDTSPIKSFARGLVFRESKTSGGANVCACETADISSTTEKENSDVITEASRCFVSSCDDPVSREEYGLFPEICRKHCDLVGTWVSGVSDLLTKGKRLVEFDTVRYRNICKKTLEPGSYHIFSWGVFGTAVAVVCFASCVASLFPRRRRGRAIVAGIVAIVGIGLAVLAGFMCAGEPSCELGKPVCRSVAFGNKIPNDLCLENLPCECTNDQMCGHGNECTEEGLCIGKLTGKRDVVERHRPLHFRTISFVVLVPCTLLAVTAGFGTGRTFLYDPSIKKQLVLAILFMLAMALISIGWVHFTSTPAKTYASMSLHPPSITFSDGTSVVVVPTAGARCATLQDSREAVSASKGRFSSVGFGWVVSGPDGSRIAVFEVAGPATMIVTYPPGDGEPRVLVSSSSSLALSSVQCS